MTEPQIRFGPSGNSERFYNEGNKASWQAMSWQHALGLDAYEYSCTKSLSVKQETCLKIGEEATRYGILMSVHAPYYINLATDTDEKRQKTIEYILDSLQIATWLNAKRVVFHPGSPGKLTRDQALTRAQTVLEQVIRQAEGYLDQGIHLCPETMGKTNQLGTVEEVVELCKLHPMLLPTLDFGHINARSQGGLQTKDDFARVLDILEAHLTPQQARSFHSHFSRIEYTAKGEKRHWTLADTQYGPEFEPLAAVLAERKLTPVIICESRDTMADDALQLKAIYERQGNL